MRLRLLDGRLFTRGDGTGAPRVLVVNETFAREVLGGAPAVGRRMRFLNADSDRELWEVVGGVADVTYPGARGHGGPGGSIHPATADRRRSRVRARPGRGRGPTTGDPLAAVPFLREAVAEARPGASVATVMTMDARLSSAVAEPRFYAVLAGGFAALAIVLAALGVYGLLSYTVAQKRGEIAIRMALGAQRGDVLALVVRQGPRWSPPARSLASPPRRRRAAFLRASVYGIATGAASPSSRRRSRSSPRRSSPATSRRAPRAGSSRWKSCASSRGGGENSHDQQRPPRIGARPFRRSFASTWSSRASGTRGAALDPPPDAW